MEKFKWGLIGPGLIAEKFAEDVQATENSVLYAVASRSGARKFVKRFNVPVVYDSYEALAADPNVDGIYIATPHRFHYGNAKLCLEAGKPVLCEKPLTVNQAESADLVAISREKNVFLMEALWSRYLPALRQVRAWLDDGEIGELIMVRSDFCIFKRGELHERWLNPELAGGALLDLGIYPIAVSQWVIQENPEIVQSVGILGETGVDHRLAVNMQYPSGAIAQFMTSFDFPMKNEMVIQGTDGFIHIPHSFWQADSVVLEKGGKSRLLELPFRKGGFEYEIEEAAVCIRAGKIESESMTHEDTLANMRVMDEIRAQIGLKYPFE